MLLLLDGQTKLAKSIPPKKRAHAMFLQDIILDSKLQTTVYEVAEKIKLITGVLKHINAKSHIMMVFLQHSEKRHKGREVVRYT